MLSYAPVVFSQNIVLSLFPRTRCYCAVVTFCYDELKVKIYQFCVKRLFYRVKGLLSVLGINYHLRVKKIFFLELFF